MQKLKHLLKQLEIVQNKYDQFAEKSGEHFNVFDVLGVRTNELSHSAIIGNLLNVKGKHGQKDAFLKLFINEIRDKFHDENRNLIITNFKTENSFLQIEKGIGRVDLENNFGGRIDILLNDGKSNIIIENKVYAGDQDKQLLRYFEFDKNAPLLYLTLDGKEPSANSKNDLKVSNQFICISYKVEIKNWLEKCIKEMVNKPIIRETLNQYLYLINLLTNQLPNDHKMEVKALIKQNLRESQMIVSHFEEANNEVISEFWENYILTLIKYFPDWIIEKAPSDFHEPYCYILMHQKNNNAYFYTRYNTKGGEITYGIVANLQHRNLPFQEVHHQLKINQALGKFSIVWKNEENFSFKTIDDLISIQINPKDVEKRLTDNLQEFINFNINNYEKILEFINSTIKI